MQHEDRIKTDGKYDTDNAVFWNHRTVQEKLENNLNTLRHSPRLRRPLNSAGA
jgi:hypothetical protein